MYPYGSSKDIMPKKNHNNITIHKTLMMLQEKTWKNITGIGLILLTIHIEY